MSSSSLIALLSLRFNQTITIPNNLYKLSSILLQYLKKKSFQYMGCKWLNSHSILQQPCSAYTFPHSLSSPLLSHSLSFSHTLAWKHTLSLFLFAFHSKCLSLLVTKPLGFPFSSVTSLSLIHTYTHLVRTVLSGTSGIHRMSTLLKE